MKTFIKKDSITTDYFIVNDEDGNRITGLVNGNFTKYLYNPSNSEVSGSIPVTVTELGNGIYRINFTPNAVGSWCLIIIHATYFPYGLTENYDCVENLNDDIVIEIDANETKIDTMDGNIDSIKGTVDTNLNATISSRSTLTAQQVWEYATRTLSSFGTLIANIWSYATRILTAGTKDSEIDAIKAKTDSLNFTGDDVKATLSDEEVDIGKVKGVPVTSIDDFKGSDMTVAQIADAVWEEVLSDHVRNTGKTRAAEIIRGLILGAYSWNESTKVFSILAADGVTILKSFTVSTTGRI